MIRVCEEDDDNSDNVDYVHFLVWFIALFFPVPPAPVLCVCVCVCVCAFLFLILVTSLIVSTKASLTIIMYF